MVKTQEERLTDSNTAPAGWLPRLIRWPYWLLVLAPLILLAPVWLTGRALFWGTPGLQFAPWWAWAWETFLDGHLPLWNPLLGMGAPLVGNYQSALFYPPYWSYFLVFILGGISAMVWWQAIVAALHLVWAGVGMALLVRRLGYGRLAQLVSGLAFGLSGYLVARAWFASINAAVAWLPWILLFSFELVREKRSLTRITRLGIVIAMQLLSGHAQTSWYTLLLAGIWIAFWAWQAKSGIVARSKEVLVSWLWYIAAGLLGAALSAVQLLPTAEYLLQSQRASAVDFEMGLTYSFWPWRFLTFLAPDFFGNPVRGNYWGYANFWEDSVYIGLLPFLLAFGVIIGFLWNRFRRRKFDHHPNSIAQPPPPCRFSCWSSA
jgi:hypothetical protein